MKNNLITLNSYGEGSKIDAIIGVRHNGSLEKTIEQYKPYLKELCPHYQLLETLHQIEEDSGTAELAHMLASQLSQQVRNRVLVVFYEESRILVEQNRIYKSGHTDRRLRNIVDPHLNPAAYELLEQKALQNHQMGDQAMVELLKAIRPGGVYIDLHSMGNHNPISTKKLHSSDTSIPLEIDPYNIPEYIHYWRSPQGNERDSSFLVSLPGQLRVDSQKLTQSIRHKLGQVGITSTLNDPYTLSASQACYRDAEMARNNFHISIPDLKKEILCDEKQPGIFQPNAYKVHQVASAFLQAIQGILQPTQVNAKSYLPPLIDINY